MEGSGILQSIKWICSASADLAGLILHPNDEQAELTVANSGTPSCLVSKKEIYIYISSTYTLSDLRSKLQSHIYIMVSHLLIIQCVNTYVY